MLFRSYFLSKKNYQPVKKLTQLFSGNTEKSQQGERNEFRFLENSVVELLSNMALTGRKLQSQTVIVRENLLAKLIRGQVKMCDDLHRQLADHSIIFTSDQFAVMICRVEKIVDLFTGSDSVARTQNLVSFVVRNVLEELINEKNRCYFVEIGNSLVCLVNYQPRSGQSTDVCDQIDELEKIAVIAANLIAENFQAQLSIAISNTQTSADSIHAAYLQALDAEEYKTLMAYEDNVILYRTLQQGSRTDYGSGSSFENERKFINFISAGDFANARSVINEIFDEDFPEYCRSLQVAKYHMFGLVSFMLKAIGEIRPALDAQFFKESDPVSRLLNSRSIVDLQQQVNLIFDQIEQHLIDRKIGPHTDKADEIVEYVKNNCFNTSLSITELTEVFSISRSHISRIFNKKVGVGFVEYIHKLRVEKAKELLLNPELSIKRISEIVGFNNSTALIRVFRNVEGVSPGIYRNNMPDNSKYNEKESHE